jgi:hypothetical protein
MNDERTKHDLWLLALLLVGVMATVLVVRLTVKGAGPSVPPDDEKAARRAAEARECAGYCKHGLLRIEWKDGSLSACECAYSE